MSNASVNVRCNGVLGSLAWIAGICIAKGFWSTFFAVIFPPWGWYLIVDLVLRHYGLL